MGLIELNKYKIRPDRPDLTWHTQFTILNHIGREKKFSFCYNAAYIFSFCYSVV